MFLKRTLTFLLALAVAGAFLPAVYGASAKDKTRDKSAKGGAAKKGARKGGATDDGNWVVFRGRDGAKFSDKKVWDTEECPDAYAYVVIAKGDAVVDSDVGTVHSMGLGGVESRGGLRVSEGGKLTMLTNIAIPRTGDVKHPIADLTLDGGELILAPDEEREVRGRLHIGAGQTHSGTGNVTFSKGIFRGSIVMGAEVIPQQSPHLTISGGLADILDDKRGGIFCMWSPATLHLVPDSETGLSPIRITSGSVRLAAGAKIVAHGDNYRGPTKTFPIFETPRFKNDGATYEVSGFGSSYTATISNAADGPVLRIVKKGR